MGFEVSTDPNIRKDAWLFGEGQCRVVVGVSHAMKHDFEAAMGDHHFVHIGDVKAHGNVVVDGDNWGNISEWKDLYDTAIEKLVNS